MEGWYQPTRYCAPPCRVSLSPQPRGAPLDLVHTTHVGAHLIHPRQQSDSSMRTMARRLSGGAVAAHWITFISMFSCTLFLGYSSWTAKGPSSKQRYFAGYNEVAHPLPVPLISVAWCFFFFFFTLFTGPRR